MSSISKLASVPCIRLVENVAAPEVKVDGQNSNRGADARGNFTLQKPGKNHRWYSGLEKISQSLLVFFEDKLVKLEGMPGYRPHFTQVNDDDDEEFPEPAQYPQSSLESDDDSNIDVYDMQQDEENENLDPINL